MKVIATNATMMMRSILFFGAHAAVVIFQFIDEKDFARRQWRPGLSAITWAVVTAGLSAIFALDNFAHAGGRSRRAAMLMSSPCFTFFVPA